MENELPIVSFYRGQIPDAAGRKIEDIWKFDDIALEGVHNYIQNLFPLPEPSPFNKNGFILDEATIKAFNEDAILRDRLLVSLGVMLRFYRLEIKDNKIQPIGFNNQFDFSTLHWITVGNHNYRRLTRIMSCLRLLGWRQFAEALYCCLINITVNIRCLYCDEKKDRIDYVTLGYWKEAVLGPPESN